MQKAGKSVNNTIHNENIFGGGFRAWEKTVAVSDVNFNRQIRNNLFLKITEVETVHTRIVVVTNFSVTLLSY